MKNVISLTAFLSGLLLLLVPRYILPACEYEGYPAMHCSDTAHAEYIVGAVLLAVGIGAFLLKSAPMSIVSAVVSIILYVIAFLLPDKYGYCHSSRMPCNYGMVPGVRFVAGVSGIIMAVAIISLLKSIRKRGNS